MKMSTKKINWEDKTMGIYYTDPNVVIDEYKKKLDVEVWHDPENNYDITIIKTEQEYTADFLILLKKLIKDFKKEID